MWVKEESSVPTSHSLLPVFLGRGKHLGVNLASLIQQWSSLNPEATSTKPSPHPGHCEEDFR